MMMVCLVLLLNYELLMTRAQHAARTESQRAEHAAGAIVKDIPLHAFPITRGHIITLHPEAALSLLTAAQQFLQIQNMTIFHAINGSQAVHSDAAANSVSLYTQYLMLSGPSPLSQSLF